MSKSFPSWMTTSSIIGLLLSHKWELKSGSPHRGYLFTHLTPNGKRLFIRLTRNNVVTNATMR